jgi:hypothetical protein
MKVLTDDINKTLFKKAILRGRLFLCRREENSLRERREERGVRSIPFGIGV